MFKNTADDMKKAVKQIVDNNFYQENLSKMARLAQAKKARNVGLALLGQLCIRVWD